MLVLEEWDRAVDRGATIIGEVLGAGSTADAYHITAPVARRERRRGLHRAGPGGRRPAPADIRQINAHGTSTPLNDAAEAEAVAKVFGSPGPPMTSIKGVTGHALGGAGALEAVSVLLSFEKALIPPTAGTTEVDPAITSDVVIGEPRPWEPGPTISNSFGFGATTGA